MSKLTLHVKKKWFDLISSGNKKVEYRWYKPYWIKRIDGKHFDVVEFWNGYELHSPKIVLKCKGVKVVNRVTDLGEGKQFAILLGDVVKEVLI